MPVVIKVCGCLTVTAVNPDKTEIVYTDKRGITPKMREQEQEEKVKKEKLAKELEEKEKARQEKERAEKEKAKEDKEKVK